MLHRVRGAVQRALDGEDDAERLRDLLDLLLVPRGLSATGLAGDLDRVLAVLALDTPAVWTIATAVLTGRRDAAWHQARREVAAAWWEAGIGPC